MSLPARYYGTQSSQNPTESRVLAFFAIKYLSGPFPHVKALRDRTCVTRTDDKLMREKCVKEQFSAE